MNAQPDSPLDPQQHALIEEWKSLQHSVDRYESCSLAIKMSAFVLTLAAVALEIPTTIALSIIALIWFQEAIWKTFQSRTEERLLRLEAAWNMQELNTTLRFYTDWQEQRPGITGLVVEYLKNAFRPTIAYPYGLLLVLGALA